MDQKALLAAIRDSLIEGLRPARQVRSVGSFVFAYEPTNDLVWLNSSFVVGEVTASDVAAWLQVVAEAGRQPWLEYSPDLSPEAATVLEASGLVCHRQMPLMVLTKESWVKSDWRTLAHGPSNVEIQSGIMIANEAFGQPAPPDKAWMRVRDAAESGRVLVSVGVDGGRVVAMGQAVGTPKIREIAGIATHHAYRRRGYATAVINCLLEQFFAGGGELAWLTPGDDGAQSVYQKIGFVEIASQVCYGLPDSA